MFPSLRSALYLVIFHTLILGVAAQAAPVAGWGANVPHLSGQSTVRGEIVFFITHATSDFDREMSIKENVNKRIADAENSAIPVLYLVDDDSASSLKNYYLVYRPNFLLLSGGGEHSVHTSAKQLIFAGGFWDTCAEETIRDAILLNDNQGGPTRANLLTDSLYNGSAYTLKDAIRPLGDDATIEYLRHTFFFDGRFAGLQDQMTFEIFRDGRKIGEFGQGPRNVEINFVIDATISDLISK